MATYIRRVENPHVRTLSLSTRNNLYIYIRVPAGNKYKNTCRNRLVIITDRKIGINKITEIIHKDTYEWPMNGLDDESYENPMKYLINQISNLGTQTQGRQKAT